MPDTSLRFALLSFGKTFLGREVQTLKWKMIILFMHVQGYENMHVYVNRNFSEHLFNNLCGETVFT